MLSLLHRWWNRPDQTTDDAYPMYVDGWWTPTNPEPVAAEQTPLDLPMPPTRDILLLGGPCAGRAAPVSAGLQIIHEINPVDWAPVTYLVHPHSDYAIISAPASPDRAAHPHCDQWVLHAPGSCRHCDAYPDRQADRITNKVAFTGDPVKYGWTECPAGQARPVARINAWPGNRPLPQTITVTHGDLRFYDDDDVIDGQIDDDPAPVDWRDIATRLVDGIYWQIGATDTVQAMSNATAAAYIDARTALDGNASDCASIHPAVAISLAVDYRAARRELAESCKAAGISVDTAAAAWPDIRRLCDQIDRFAAVTGIDL